MSETMEEGKIFILTLPYHINYDIFNIRHKELKLVFTKITNFINFNYV